MKKITLLLIMLFLITGMSSAASLKKTIGNVSMTTEIPAGRTITLRYVKDAENFVKWVVKTGNVTLTNPTSTTVSFTMPNQAVEIEAEEIVSKVLTVSVDGEVAEVTEITVGESITVTAVEGQWKEFNGWQITGLTGADVTANPLTFTMPNNNVEVIATFLVTHVCEYSAATCTTPPTCSCGATTGSALGHTWVDATCTTAKTCSVCAATEGSALGHSYTGTVTCGVNGSTDTVQCIRCTSTESQTCTHTYTISKGSVTNGTVTLSATSVKAGGSATATITPSSGYQISSIKVNGSAVSITNKLGMTYTFSNVTSNQTINVTFGVKTTTAWNAPVLLAGLTPVNWSGSAWTATTESSWSYDYNSVAEATHSTVAGNGSGKWANAQTADGSLYVWIPRYSYKIESGENQAGIKSWNSLTDPGTGSTAGKISIKFSSGTTDDTSNSYRAHPAFDFGGTQLTGIWVAKYRYGKPDEYTLNNNSIEGAFEDAFETFRSADSHLMKNTEWGAVAYLTNAIGRIPYVNNNILTGYAAGSEVTPYGDTSYKWDTAEGVKGSTTHNVYGIYDMSVANDEGEYVAAYLDIPDVELDTDFASLVTEYQLTGSKYVDVYPASGDGTDADANFALWKGTIYGDAMWETSAITTETSSAHAGYIYQAWDNDETYPPHHVSGMSSIGIVRGGGFYGDTGIFAYRDGWGYTAASYGSRVVLTGLAPNDGNIQRVKVTFDGNGGYTYDSIKRVAYNNTYGTLPTPYRTDYIFLGWYTSATGGAKVTDTTTVTTTSDHTLYAHWQAKPTYTITVTQGSNGTISPSTTTVVEGKSKSFTITPNTGYKISTLVVDGSSKTVTNNQKMTHTFSNVTANHTIKATFTTATYCSGTTCTTSAYCDGNTLTECENCGHIHIYNGWTKCDEEMYDGVNITYCECIDGPSCNHEMYKTHYYCSIHNFYSSTHGQAHCAHGKTAEHYY